MTPELDARVLADALDAWEADPHAYTGTIWEAFTALCPTEAQVLFQLAQGNWYGDGDVAAVVRLIELGLIRRTASLTPMGERLLDASGHKKRRATRRQEAARKATRTR